MSKFRHAGMHWPTGGENPSRQTIYDLPGVKQGGLIMLADSARWWYDEARWKSPLVIWRGLPRLGKFPADLQWNPVLVANEVLNHWLDQPHHGTEYFTPLNELQFSFESGHGEFPGFKFLADKLGLLRVELRKRLPDTVKLVWPAWGPDQPYMDAPFVEADEWIREAAKWDVISAHVYSHNTSVPEHFGAANVERTHDWYRQTFPNHPIVYTEWNANHTGSTEREMLEAMARICSVDPLCLGFMYYIWETQRPGERQLSVWGNSARLNLFRDPPQQPEPQMYLLPDRVPPTKEIFDRAVDIAREKGIDPVTFIALLIAESGYNFDKLARWRQYTAQAEDAIAREDWGTLENTLNLIAAQNSDDISFGPAHQAYRWSREYDVGTHPAFRYDLGRIMAFRKLYIENPDHALRVAATTLQYYLDRHGDALEALCRYNRPSVAGINNPNRGNYVNALALAPQRIAELTTPEPEEPMPEYQFGFKDLADRLGRETVGDPLTDEQYFTDDVSLQFTERGMMVYSKTANKPYFFEAAR
jgi:hypothetical protein